MASHRFVLVACLGAALLGAAGATTTAAPPAPLFEERTHAATGLVYDFLTPGGWSPGAPVALFVCLHGAGDTKNNFRGTLDGMIPPMRDHLRIYIDSPSRQGWPGECDAQILQLVKDLQRECRPRWVIGVGFSAGGYLTTSTAFPNPELYVGGLIAGATFRTAPPREGLAKQRFWYWSLGENDPNVKASGGIDGVKRALEAAKYDAEHAVVEVVPGLAHRLDAASMTKGVEWILAQAAAAERMTPEDKALADSVTEPLKAGDVAAIRAIADRLLATRRSESLRYFWGKIKSLPTSSDAALADLGIALAGACGDPRAVKELERALGKARDDAARQTAIIGAMGRCGDGAVKPLTKLLGKWDHDGAPQLAAAKALGALGARAAIPALLSALKSAERKDDRAAYVTACDAALAAITGATCAGSKAWTDWLRQQPR